MSNFKRIRETLDRGEQVFMKDDFLEVAIRLTGGDTSFLKHKGHEEREISHTYEVFLDVEMGGEFITEQEYLDY